MDQDKNFKKYKKCEVCGREMTNRKECIFCGNDKRTFFGRHKFLILISIVLLGIFISRSTKTLYQNNFLERFTIEEKYAPLEINEDLEEAEEDILEDDLEYDLEYEEETINREASTYKVATIIMESPGYKKINNSSIKKERLEFLNRANVYANYMNFSKSNIYTQLGSKNAEALPREIIDHLLENIDVDWKENALKKSEIYYHEMDMPKEEIYDQLISIHGDGFTKEEAQYAIDNLD